MVLHPLAQILAKTKAVILVLLEEKLKLELLIAVGQRCGRQYTSATPQEREQLVPGKCRKPIVE